jgi:hypothetical protein
MTAIKIPQSTTTRLRLIAFSGILLLLSFDAISAGNNSLDFIFGNTANKSYVPRVKAVHKLGNDLQPAQIAAIYKFLHKRIKDDSLKPLELNAIKNELVIVIMNQRNYPDALASSLVEMYNDKSFDKIWRDYCIQFLGQWYPKINSPEDRRKAREAFDSALQEKKNGIAGTALIAVSRLTGLKDFDKADIASKAFELAKDKDSANIVKITALQVGANLGNKNILPLAKELIKSSKSVPLKMSAIAAVGILGNSADIPTIDKYLKCSDVRLRTAAKAAVKRLEHK